jgi:hypothetical protein
MTPRVGLSRIVIVEFDICRMQIVILAGQIHIPIYAESDYRGSCAALRLRLRAVQASLSFIARLAVALKRSMYDATLSESKWCGVPQAVGTTT